MSTVLNHSPPYSIHSGTSSSTSSSSSSSKDSGQSPLALSRSSTLLFGIAHVFASLTVSNYELRDKALAEKGLSAEQYEQLKELQRIKTKDANGVEVKVIMR